jgi:site-specific DNA-methyltransferase (adenine-specific)
METERKELLKMCEGKKYNVIYADPAWRFSQGINRRKDIREKFGTNEELSIQYPTMSDKEIIELNVSDYADDNCVLFVWTTDAHLEVAIKAINNWGFKYKTVAFTWNKKRGFMGKWTVKQCEICLLATKGTAHKLLKSFKEKSYLEENKTEHSKKPNEFRKRIERMFGDVPKLEMFARTRAEGWDAWGNETDKFEEEQGREIFNNSFPAQSLFGDVS